MKANLVRTVKLGRRTHYIYSCIDCGNEYIRAVYGKHINPYCADCNRKYLRERQKKQLELKQQAHDKQIKTDTIDEFLKELYPCKYKHNDDCSLCKGIRYCLVFDAERIAEQMKEQRND